MDTRKAMDIFAYYLSEYDKDAFDALGYATQTAGFDTIASLFGKKSSYLRRLRDEYDVLSNSTRNGQRNRLPRNRIIQVFKHLAEYSFEELTEMVNAFIVNANPEQSDVQTIPGDKTLLPLSELELESIINFKDDGATIRVKTGNNKIRVYNTSIIKQGSEQ